MLWWPFSSFCQLNRWLICLSVVSIIVSITVRRVALGIIAITTCGIALSSLTFLCIYIS